MLRKILWSGLYAVLGAAALAEDAVFLRKLKPSLAKRVRGEAPKDGKQGEVRLAPSGPQLGGRPSPTGGPSPFLVLGAAFAAGILLAKWIDWRGHDHSGG
jgi:hypothetical protein